MSGYIIKGHAFSPPPIEPALYLASTPIGNLSDITIRVLDSLAGCDLIACEDTRVTGKLLNHFSIRTKKTAYHEHNADKVGPKLVETIQGGQSVVLVSDAGTPLVSDPGYRLARACMAAGLKVIPLPGPSAPLAALVASGLSAVSWKFSGFLPTKKNARMSAIAAHTKGSETAIFFESPNRLNKALEDMEEVLGPDRLVSVAREITKLHEEIVTDTVSALRMHFASGSIKGEIVLLVSPGENKNEQDPDALLYDMLKTMTVSKAATEAAQLTGLSKRELYQRALQLKDQA